MNYCIEFEKKRIYKDTDTAISILTQSNGGTFINLPKKYRHGGDLTELEYFQEQLFKENSKQFDMARVVIPQWLYDNHSESLKKISLVTIESWEDGKVEPVFTNRK